MQITKRLGKVKTELLLFPAPEKGDSGADLRNEFKQLFSGIELEPFLASLGVKEESEDPVLWAPGGKSSIKRILFIPRSSEKDLDTDRLRTIGAACAKRAGKLGVQELSIHESLFFSGGRTGQRALLEGFGLGQYEFTKFTKKKNTPLKTVHVWTKKKLSKTLSDQARVIAEGVCYARDLVNLPAQECTPSFLASEARKIGKMSGVSVEVLRLPALKQQKANGILGVSRGSSQSPVLIKLRYKPQGKGRAGRIGLVGKGVTFDSGGLSIKSGSGMETMKCDMAGAAAVLGTFRTLSRLKPKYEVRGYVPAVENMIQGNAMKPGDVLKMMNGKTVEVLNTDAEGRLILADALHIACSEKCQEVVDLATLTGSCAVALGEEYAGLFSNDDKLERKLLQAAEAGGENLWALPLVPEYKEHLKSTIADIKNVGKRTGGAISAALFLEHFISKKASWAHIDIAGPAFTSSATKLGPAGGTGYGVRTLISFLTI